MRPRDLREILTIQTTLLAPNRWWTLSTRYYRHARWRGVAHGYQPSDAIRQLCVIQIAARTIRRLAAVIGATSAFAEDPAYIGRHQSTPEDVNAIMQLTKDFRAALIDKNVKQMSTLMFGSDILFASPASAATVKMINDKEDVNFDGVPSGGYGRFAQFVGSTRGSTEEKFYNIKITQDGHLAWVIFDFDGPGAQAAPANPRIGLAKGASRACTPNGPAITQVVRQAQGRPCC